MTELANKACVPCREGSPPVSAETIRAYLQELHPDWEAFGQDKLERVFHFDDFQQAMAFANRIAELAEQDRHHPVLTVSWGKLKVVLRTMKIRALHDNDFILAAKIDKLAK